MILQTKKKATMLTLVALDLARQAKNTKGQFPRQEKENLIHTKADRSTVKTPMGAFEEDEIPNDVTLVLKALEEY